MSGIGASGVGSGDLSTRLKIVDILPTAATGLLVSAIVLAGAPGQAPSVDVFITSAKTYGPIGLIALSVAVTAVSVALQPLELSLIRLLEGYWPRRGIAGRIAGTAEWVQSRRRSAVLHIAARTGKDPHASRARAQQSQWPEDKADLLPTALGNRLRAMERRSGTGYGLDAVLSFPRLYLVLPQSATAALSDLRNQLDASVRSCAMTAVASVVTLALLYPYGLWLLVPAATAALCVASYRASLVAASNYGELVAAAFNVYHLKILDETGVKRPRDSVEMRRLHRELERMQRGSDEPNVPYADPPKPGVEMVELNEGGAPG